MSLQDRIKPYVKLLKITCLVGSGALFVTYNIKRTLQSIDSIVNPSVLSTEKKYTPEYIYIDDPTYGANLKMEQARENKQPVGFARIWKSLQHSITWRLLWLCRHGNAEQRNVALQQLANFKSNKNWDCVKIAQALDQHTAVLLARTRGADLRYFLPPPAHVRRAALAPELMSFKLRDLVAAAEGTNPHSCILHFLSKYFANIQEQAMEADVIPTKPDSISERDLCMVCLDALHHHISLFYNIVYHEDTSAVALIAKGLLPTLSELLLRHRDDTDMDLAVLRILTVLSLHTNLLTDFFQNGLIRELSRLVRSKDVRLSSSAAVSLANLSGEFCYRPGLYLLYPLYRTTTPHQCDILLVHGLRGGVFVTWRQRDKKCAEPIGIIEVTVSDVDCEPCEEILVDGFTDPELNQMIEDLNVMDEEALLGDFDVLLHDLPIEGKRDHANTTYTVHKKRLALKNEEVDKCNYTFCWPKDWLPKDCDNLRILGVNYWSSLSEWLERCPLQMADIATRAEELSPNLIDAGVGKKNIPVVWLAHSMGGLIVKQALIEGAQSQDDAYKKLCDNTRAVLFFSTPHKGSALATMPRAAAAVLWPSNDVRQLQVDSPVLLELQKSFIKFADTYQWETISFAETMPTLVTAFKVPIHFVEASSADLGRGVFYQLPLDHLSICKPATRESLLYTTVLDVIQRHTNKKNEICYSNPIMQLLIRFYLWLTSKKSGDGAETMEDAQTNANEGTPWTKELLHMFKQLL